MAKITKHDSFPEINIDRVIITVKLEASFSVENNEDIDMVRGVIDRAKDELTAVGGVDVEKYEVDYGSTGKKR